MAVEPNAKLNAQLDVSEEHSFADLAQALSTWYLEHARPLPWRQSRDPYRIWISEVMLQQTTVTAVTPYYIRFLERFPDLNTLAQAPLAEVIDAWAGLGYYSRARALHKSAIELRHRESFPTTHEELMQLPGFGPYTSRAVASLAFAEPVGVVDGNVIRVLSRLLDLDLEWWKPKVRDQIQVQADRLAQAVKDSSVVNQGLMELGATICTPSTSPSCLICPWTSACLARQNATIEKRPTKKPRKETEFWLWKVHLIQVRSEYKKSHIMLVANDYAPFLKGHLVPIGEIRKLRTRPKNFDVKGSVTHHEIFVQIDKHSLVKTRSEAKHFLKHSCWNPTWIPVDQIRAHVPSSLIRKALDAINHI
jgi:A/G-specific adenine glycosylase